MDPLTDKNQQDQQLMPEPSALQLQAALWRQMLLDVINKAPQEEACGLLSGHIERGYYRALQVHPITNQLHSPTRYNMAPQEILAVFNEIERKGNELVGIYHSHLNGPEFPSETDINQAYYPECVYLIWSPQGKAWNCRGYLIQGGQLSQVTLIIDE